MTRITKKSVGKSEEYLTHKQLSQQVGEEMDCAVRAVAIATNISYEESRKLLNKNGRKHGGRTPFGVISKSIRELGFTVTKYSIAERIGIIKQYPGKHKGKTTITTHHPDRFPEVWKNGKTYLLFTRGHVLCVKDGINHDWTRGRSLQVIDMWEVS